MLAEHMPVRVKMVGLRGFPDVQGGVETHAEHLCPRLVEMGCDVQVLMRSPYKPKDSEPTWHGVRMRRIWSPKSKGLETILHTFLGVLYAGFVERPQILHIQAIGPALLAPLARLLGLRVVVTHHGPDYDREKWGPFAKWILRTGEAWGMRFANRRIVISETIRKLVRDKYGLESDLIPNGVELPEIPPTTDALKKFGLEPGRYVLMVTRLVPEKRHIDLIQAFAKARCEGWKLAIVGASDHPDAYQQEVLSLVKKTPGVVATGFQRGLALSELYAHAGLFVLPSSHEGLPIAMLEALSYGLPVVASDIPANLEIGLDLDHYFRLGNVSQLAGRIERFANRPFDTATKEATRRWVVTRYDWQVIARDTSLLYRVVAADRKLPALPDRSRETSHR